MPSGTLHERAHLEALRPGDIDNAIYRRGHRAIGHGVRDVRRDGPDQCGRESYGLALRGGLRDAAEKFRELRRPDDRVGNAGIPNQRLLGHLGAEVAALREPVGANHGRRDVMADACRLLGCGQIAADVSKKFRTALSSNDGELATSTTTCAPASASAKPSPVKALTPVCGEAATASRPCATSRATTFWPMRPVPPMTTIFIIVLHADVERILAHGR